MTRGLSLNNPLNIRHGAPWRGLAAEQPDREFCNFSWAIYGLRAGGVILANYRHLHRVDTLAAVAARWAPPVENDTEAYAATLSRFSRFGVAEPVDLTAPAVLVRVIPALCVAENGQQPYAPCQIEDAVLLACAPETRP